MNLAVDILAGVGAGSFTAATIVLIGGFAPMLRLPRLGVTR
jgi:hypothetical protein